MADGDNKTRRGKHARRLRFNHFYIIRCACFSDIERQHDKTFKFILFCFFWVDGGNAFNW